MNEADQTCIHQAMRDIALLLDALDRALTTADALPVWREKLHECDRSVSRAIQRLNAVGLTCPVNGSTGGDEDVQGEVHSPLLHRLFHFWK